MTFIPSFWWQCRARENPNPESQPVMKTAAFLPLSSWALFPVPLVDTALVTPQVSPIATVVPQSNCPDLDRPDSTEVNPCMFGMGYFPSNTR